MSDDELARLLTLIWLLLLIAVPVYTALTLH